MFLCMFCSGFLFLPSGENKHSVGIRCVLALANCFSVRWLITCSIINQTTQANCRLSLTTMTFYPFNPYVKLHEVRKQRVSVAHLPTTWAFEMFHSFPRLTVSEKVSSSSIFNWEKTMPANCYHAQVALMNIRRCFFFLCQMIKPIKNYEYANWNN